LERGILWQHCTAFLFYFCGRVGAVSFCPFSLSFDAPTKNKAALPKIRWCFVAFSHYREKKGVNEYVIATKVSFYNIFILQPKFTLVYTLFSMVTRQKDIFGSVCMHV